jgi:hypothetical protein
LAALLAGVALLAGGCGSPPPNQAIEIPELVLTRTMRQGVLRAYGPPRIKTAFELWYVGPVRKSLEHGADGWMCLLIFDTRTRLISQEQLRKRHEQGYGVADYHLRGDITDRDRDKDFDTLMKAHCRELAGENPEYLVTTDDEGLFVLARRLPSENEEVARWSWRSDTPVSGYGPQTQPEKIIGDIRMTVRGLPGRDEPLLTRMDGAIGQRVLLIGIIKDAEAFPVTDFTPGSGR